MRKSILTILIVLYATIAVAQKPTRQEFVAVCDSLGVKHPNVVWAQARLESGNFESKTYKQKRNCLGIYDSKRKQYAWFNSWQECVEAYRDRVQKKRGNVTETDEAYLLWLVSMGYAADKNYANKVRKIMRKAEN
jgi:flagellum-specific peptidoglycan hydrolase FlgJ